MTDSDPSDIAQELSDEIGLSRAEVCRIANKECEGRNYVPVEALQELVSEWDNSAFIDTRAKKYDVGEVDGLVTAAAELQALIDDYSNE